MASEGVITRSQKDATQVQQELTKLQLEVSQLNSKLKAWMKEFMDDFRLEMKGLFEQYLGNSTQAMPTALQLTKGRE